MFFPRCRVLQRAAVPCMPRCYVHKRTRRIRNAYSMVPLSKKHRYEFRSRTADGGVLLLRRVTQLKYIDSGDNRTRVMAYCLYETPRGDGECQGEGWSG